MRGFLRLQACRWYFRESPVKKRTSTAVVRLFVSVACIVQSLRKGDTDRHRCDYISVLVLLLLNNINVVELGRKC